MRLYRTHVIHWNLNIGDRVSYIRNPFFEYQLDPVFEVIGVGENTVDLRVLDSTNTEIIGNEYFDQPLYGLKKTKYTSLTEEFTYDKTV